MNMRDYPISNENKVNKQHLYSCSAFHNHSKGFNYEQNSYPKMSVTLSLSLQL